MYFFFKNYILNTLILFLVYIPYVLAQENAFIQFLEDKLENHVEYLGSEKVYVQTDKDFYRVGNTIWFKAYLVDGITHTPTTKSKVLHIELLNDKDSIIAKRKLYVENIGASGDIKITNDIVEGIYRLRGYTQYMLNEKEPFFFEKEISIWGQKTNQDKVRKDFAENETKEVSISKVSKPRIRFFPEGGHLVNKLKSKIGIKVTDSVGEGISLLGKIVDENDSLISFFRSYDFGLGAFNLMPQAGKKYYARILNDKTEAKFELPKPLEKGYVMIIENKGDQVLIRVASNIKEGLEGALLLGHLRGQVIFKQRLNPFKNEDSYLVKFLTDGLTDGVAHFTLFTPEGEPVCERLIFVDRQDNDASLRITTNAEKFGERQLVEASLQITDSHDLPLEGNLSMSVASTAKHMKGQKASNIKSWLLLDSDIGSTVPDFDYFFKNPTFSQRYLLDVLMLTHGWRRFVWKDVLDKTAFNELAFPPEKGIMVNGITTAFRNQDEPRQADVKLSLVGSNGSIYQENVETDLQGQFHFGPYVFEDIAEVILEANGQKRNGKSRNVAVYNKPVLKAIPAQSFRKRKNETQTTTTILNELKEAYRKGLADFEYDPEVTVLEGVTVTEKKKTRQDLVNEAIKDLKKLYITPTHRIFVDSTSFSITDVYRKRGIRVSANAVYLLDGSPIGADMVEHLNPSNIEFVDVIRTYDIGGPSYGFVAIYTKAGLNIPSENEAFPGVTNFEVAGFYKTREFYSPNYGEQKKEHNKPDYRTTLHWEPFIKTSEKGAKPTTFYTGDNLGEYIIKVEGITEDGRTVHGFHQFSVEK